MTTAKYMRAITIVLLIALLAGTTMLTACGGSGGTQTAQSGDTVNVSYVGTLDNGSVFQSSADVFEGGVMTFTIDVDQMIPAFTQAVINMSVNQSKTIHIPFEDAYGPTKVTLNISSTDTPPTVGQQYTVTLANGKLMSAIAINVTNTSVTFQNAHPLAGQNLTFQITLVEIVKKK